MDDEENPLEDLYIEEKPYDEERLSKVLSRYIGIDPTDDSVVLKAEFSNLDEKQKVICYLLYRRALHGLDKLVESEIPQKAHEIAEGVDMREVDVDDICYKLSIIEPQSEHYGPYKIIPSNIDIAVSYVEGNVATDEKSGLFSL